MAADNLDGAPGHVQGGGEECDQGFVGRPVNRRRGNSDSQSAIVLSGKLATGSARNYSNREREVAVVCGILNHSGEILNGHFEIVNRSSD